MHLLVCLACLCLVVGVNAQKFDYEKLTLKYELKAETPFTTEFKSITVRLNGEEHLKRYGLLPSDIIASDFKFERFQNLEEHGDLHLDVFIGEPEFLGVELEKSSKKVDDKDVTTYYYVGTVITPMTYELRDGARDIIEEKIVYSAADHFNFSSESYSSTNALKKAWEESKNIIITKQLGAILKKNVLNAALSFRNRFDDQFIITDVNLFDIKKAEKINAEFLNKAFAKITAALNQNPMLADWDSDKKTEIIALLTKGTKFDKEDNKERVVYAISYYNLTVLNLYWNDLDAAHTSLQAGRLADRKNYEFDQLEIVYDKLIKRGKSDDISTKAYTPSYQPGSDDKLPAKIVAVSDGVEGDDFSSKVSRSVDTVIVITGDTLIGYVEVFHRMRDLGDIEYPDFIDLVINPLNHVDDEIKVKSKDILMIIHQGKYIKPMETKVALSLNTPTNLYELLMVSDDGRLGLMRNASHESMNYTLNKEDYRAYLYAYKPSKDSDEVEIFGITASAKYLLSLNGALSKDFDFCPAIVSKADQKKYSLNDENTLTDLIEDYNSCSN